MNILILGATGRTGRLFAQAAVANNHRVTAIIRDKIKATLSGVTYFEGSPTDRRLLNDTLKGIDAVVVSLNLNRTSDSPFAKVVSPLTLISDSVSALVPAMEKNGVNRVISISASGVGDSWKDMPIVGRWFIRMSNIWKAYLDHDLQEQLLRQSDLDWTIVRPVMLTDKDSEEYRAIIGKPTAGYISRKGVARFILDALESGKYVKEVVTLNG
jgi:putative NADH-flavin reductase